MVGNGVEENPQGFRGELVFGKHRFDNPPYRGGSRLHAHVLNQHPWKTFIRFTLAEERG
jgi:hypothetical protein